MPGKIFAVGFITLALFGTALTQDPGQPDSLVIGNLDHSPVTVGPGQRAAIPIWWKLDSVTFVHIPIATNNEYVVSRNGGEFFWPSCWMTERAFQSPDTSSPSAGFTSQSLIGYAFQGADWDNCNPPPDPGPPFYQWWHIADIRLNTTNDISVMGHTTFLVEGHNPANGSLLFGGNPDLPGYIPSTFWGSLYFVTFFAGDANGNGQVNGLDVVFLVNYLKGIGPAPDPPLSGDANGDCSVNGMDVVYLTNYLKGIGLAPVVGNCP